MTEKQREWKEKRQREIKRKVLIGALAAGALITIIGGVKKLVKYDNEHLSIPEIDREIDIHSGNFLSDDGHPITYKNKHGCEMPYDGETPFEERLANKMIEEGYSEETAEAAVEKFNYKCNNENDLAEEIDLKKIEEEAKKKGKGYGK